MTRPEPCPCGSGAGLAACCGRLHARFARDGALTAPTAEALMRSRYTAFARRNADHLWRTWHPRTRPQQVADLEGVTWLGLEVLGTEAGEPDDSEGTVDFAAHFRTDAGERGAVREHSRFARRAGR